MKPACLLLQCAVVLAIPAFLIVPTAAAQGHWPAWRGPDHTGAAPSGNPPTTWSETRNIKWKVAVPGSNQSTPIIWGDKIFLLASLPADGAEAGFAAGASDGRRRMTTGTPKGDYIFDVVCLDRNTGAPLWRQTAAKETPQEGHHPTNSFAPYSAVTDGEFVWASFGSRGLHCYDMNGKHQWTTALPKMTTKRHFGEGSSPALAGDALVVVQDHEGDSRIGAYDKRTGKLRWEKPRDEITMWSTPCVVTADGVTQIIVNASNRIRSYDAATGDLIWSCGGMTMNVVPTPVSGFGKVYCASGFRGAALTAIDLNSKGDVTSAPAWNIDRGTPYVPSPLLYGERIYFLEGLNPKLSCANAKTGKLLYSRESLEGMGRMYASPVGAGGHVYIADRDGAVTVLSDADTLEVIATNHLDEGFDASPVVVGDTLYLKGTTHLYCIEES